jgi:hypothetical protein
MCPACVASAAWVAGSVMSTGGIAALAVKFGRGKKISQNENPNGAERRDVDGNNERNNGERNND